MIKGNKGSNLKLIECPSEYSNDSIDNNFHITGKYISLNPKGISVEKAKTNKYSKLVKKNTRMSSNNEEDIEYPDNEDKFLNIQLTDDNINSNSNMSDNNLILVQNKNRILYQSFSNSNLNEITNKDDKLNNSENNHINDENKIYLSKSSFSPIKKKRKIILEEKSKFNGKKGKIFSLENKENKDDKEKEKKEENKIYRKDKNGTEICKKNKKRIKIGFDQPFVKVTLVESFKNYNMLDGSPKGKRFINGKDDCNCCSIY